MIFIRACPLQFLLSPSNLYIFVKNIKAECVIHTTLAVIRCDGSLSLNLYMVCLYLETELPAFEMMR